MARKIRNLSVQDHAAGDASISPLHDNVQLKELKFRREVAYIDILIIEERLHQELVRIGFNEAAAKSFAKIAAPLAEKKLGAGEMLETAVPSVACDISAALALIDGAKAQFQAVALAELALPTALRPDQTYEGRLDRSRNPFEFYRDVWGRFEDAGIVVHQEDIRGAGDTKLVHAMRGYIQQHPKLADELKAQVPPARRGKSPAVLAGVDLSSPEALKAARALVRRAERARSR